MKEEKLKKKENCKKQESFVIDLVSNGHLLKNQVDLWKALEKSFPLWE